MNTENGENVVDFTQARSLRQRMLSEEVLRERREKDDLLIMANMLVYQRKLLQKALAQTRILFDDPLHLVAQVVVADIEEREENIVPHATERWSDDRISAEDTEKRKELRSVYDRAVKLLREGGLL